jgi:hypothetical protein
MEPIHKLARLRRHHSFAAGIVVVGNYLARRLASHASGAMLPGFWRAVLIAVLASTTLSATGGPLSPDHNHVGALGFRWGASVQDLKSAGARPIPNLRYTRPNWGTCLSLYDEKDEAFRATASLPSNQGPIDGHLDFFVDRKHGLRTVMFVVDKDFQSAADLRLYYREIKDRLVDVRGDPASIGESIGSGNRTDGGLVDCLGEGFSLASRTAASDCRMVATWMTNAARLDLVAWAVNGSGAIALIESRWPDQSARWD